MPWRGLFVGMGCFQNAGLIEGLADDLQAHRQARGRETAGYGNGRKTGQVEGFAISPPQQTMPSRILADRAGGNRRRRHHEDVEAVNDPVDFSGLIASKPLRQ